MLTAISLLLFVFYLSKIANLSKVTSFQSPEDEGN